VYSSLLIFVVVLGAPMLGAPSLRHRLRERVQTLRSAFLGEPVVQAPLMALVGENQEPFPREYERPAARPAFVALTGAPAQRRPYRIIIGGGETTPPAAETAPQSGARPPVRIGTGGSGSAPPGSRGEPQLIVRASAAAAGAQPAPEAGSDPEYRQGKSEQEAYDHLVNANSVLAGLIKGKDPALKYQDWSAANMGADTFYVMVTFAQTADGVAVKYIWSVKAMTKEIVPLSSAARSISK
jgi:hypothetical protein